MVQTATPAAGCHWLLLVMSFSRQALEGRLATLSETQNSISTLSLWLIHHQRHADESAAIWFEALRTGELAVVAVWSRCPCPSTSGWGEAAECMHSIGSCGWWCGQGVC